MELIKKHYQKIICYSLIIVSLLIALAILIFHGKPTYFWYPLFGLIVGLTLLPLSRPGGKHEK